MLLQKVLENRMSLLVFARRNTTWYSCCSRTGITFVYVRPEPKTHGRKNQIEGYIENGQTVVVIEDLISTGGSSLKAVKALEEVGCTVKGMAAIFTYGFDLSVENFKNAKCDLVTLSNYDNLIEQAMDTGYVSNKEVDALKKWRIAPDKW